MCNRGLYAISAPEWLNVEGNFIFGKHRGEFVGAVARTDPDYLEWILNNIEPIDIDHEDRQIIESYIKRS
jgi:hypothetical protein